MCNKNTMKGVTKNTLSVYCWVIKLYAPRMQISMRMKMMVLLAVKYNTTAAKRAPATVPIRR